MTGAGSVNYIAQNGIQVSRGATATVNKNTVKDNWYADSPDDVSTCGLLFYKAGGSVVVGQQVPRRGRTSQLRGSAEEAGSSTDPSIRHPLSRRGRREPPSAQVSHASVRCSPRDMPGDGAMTRCIPSGMPTAVETPPTWVKVQAPTTQAGVGLHWPCVHHRGWWVDRRIRSAPRGPSRASAKGGNVCLLAHPWRMEGEGQGGNGAVREQIHTAPPHAPESHLRSTSGAPGEAGIVASRRRRSFSLPRECKRGRPKGAA